jgi:hypothetical protein
MSMKSSAGVHRNKIRRCFYPRFPHAPHRLEITGIAALGSRAELVPRVLTAALLGVQQILDRNRWVRGAVASLLTVDMTSAAPRHVLRTLLRAIDTNITSVTGNTTWRRYALDEFRRVPANAPDAASRLQQAEDYAFLLTSVREFKVCARPAQTALGGSPRQGN